MPSNLPQQEPAPRWPLHDAALYASTRRIRERLSAGLVVDIDSRDDKGWTAVMVASCENHHRVVEVLLQNEAGVDHRNNAGFTALMVAAPRGHHRVVRTLLQSGANVSSAANVGSTALLLSSRNGHLAVADMLVRAGAELEARLKSGFTSLHMAAKQGRLAIVRLLVEAGANPDTCLPSGEDAMYGAAFYGHADVVKLLLSLGVKPARPVVQRCGETRVALDAAAEHGHRDVVRELLQLGLETCGGRSLGADSVFLAARNGHIEVTAMLRDAGVVDTRSVALFNAANNGREEVVKFLLQQEWATPGGKYVNNHDGAGGTALCYAIDAAYPRITRMLLDAGADETKACRLVHESTVVGPLKPLEFALICLAGKKIPGEVVTEDQRHRLDAICRLLLRVDAVRAASWLWSRNVPLITRIDGEAQGKRAKKGSTPLRVLIVRRRTGVRRILLASIFRHSRRP